MTLLCNEDDSAGLSSDVCSLPAESPRMLTRVVFLVESVEAEEVQLL